MTNRNTYDASNMLSLIGRMNWKVIASNNDVSNILPQMDYNLQNLNINTLKRFIHFLKLYLFIGISGVSG